MNSTSVPGAETSAPSTLELERDGLRLQALHQGEREAPLVVLLHGFPDTPHGWDAVVPHLLEAGFQVLRPWLRGYTRGSSERGADYDLISVANDIQAWLGQLGVERAHLVGHDWGAAVAGVINGTAPGCWHSFSLLAVPPVPDAGDWWRVLPALPRQLWLSRYMAVMQSQGSGAMLARDQAAAVRAIWQNWSPGWSFTEEQFAPTQRVFSDSSLGWSATRYYRQLFTLHKPATRAVWRAMAAPPSRPCLVLFGSRDGCMHAQTLRRATAAHCQAGRLHVEQLPDSGHFLQMEQPALVAQHLLQHFGNHQTIGQP